MLENLRVTIYSPAKTAMQSGTAKTNIWKIKFPADKTKYLYNLMSWPGSKDTKQQLDLEFPTKEQAIHFAEKNNWKYRVLNPQTKKILPKSYASNFTS